ncbi:YdeI family protein [Aeromicrobium panaciterrae]|uniref:YdeI/OmpD-associated family protein n=1 Tax=Aeromicrobium panaciterrae TaxID=363861 RepID=UPI0031E2D25D
MDVLDFPNAEAWSSWLQEHQGDQTEAWLRIAKKGSGLETISISDALDVALCHGWIDGQRRGNDEVSFLQRYCPRRPTSSWSQVNVAKAGVLIAAGRMLPAGFAEIEKAKADGRWNSAYEPQSTAEPPPDLIAALDADPVARAAYDALGRSERYAIILQLLKARTPEGRAKILAREVARLGKR